jgi:hypothetical protein
MKADRHEHRCGLFSLEEAASIPPPGFIPSADDLGDGIGPVGETD